MTTQVHHAEHNAVGYEHCFETKEGVRQGRQVAPAGSCVSAYMVVDGCASHVHALISQNWRTEFLAPVRTELLLVKVDDILVSGCCRFYSEALGTPWLGALFFLQYI